MYRLDLLIQGFPGRSATHGGFGWSTVFVLRGHGRTMLVDGGGLGARALLLQRLAACGIRPELVDTVFISHAHWDHAVNWTLFTEAEIVIGHSELEWALGLPTVQADVAEVYMRELRNHPRLRLIEAGEDVLDGVRSFALPGHTPGQLGFTADCGTYELVFGADAAKNRAELMTREGLMTLDEQASVRSIDVLWEKWRRRAGSVLLLGHDLPLRLEEGHPVYAEPRDVHVEVFYGTTLEETQVWSKRAAR